MAHHHHEPNDSYYLDQLSSIAICGAFAGAAITLYYWQRPILATMGFQDNSLFPTLIVWSGFALLVLVMVRALTLWRAVGQPALAGTCDHEHDHAEHMHGCDHEHHDHDHEHSHEHTHAAVGCSSGHDHGAAPWRYVVLLVPIILFLLGLPNKTPKALAHHAALVQADPQAAPAYGTLIGLGPLPLQQLALGAALTPNVVERDFKELEGAAQEEYSRKEWQGKTVRVVGQFARFQGSDRRFSLVRYRVKCCAADAVQYEIPALCQESMAGIGDNQWVKVTGRVHFQPDPKDATRQNFMTVLLVPRRQNIQRTDPDPNPYIQ